MGNEVMQTLVVRLMGRIRRRGMNCVEEEWKEEVDEPQVLRQETENLGEGILERKTSNKGMDDMKVNETGVGVDERPNEDRMRTQNMNERRK